ncbi:MAG: hypothetical protein Q4B73_04200 [Lachnospiraceae bacterium]|nr:hypothetical protein [Lachnospiraceae bacterium]
MKTCDSKRQNLRGRRRRLMKSMIAILLVVCFMFNSVAVFASSYTQHMERWSPKATDSFHYNINVLAIDSITGEPIQGVTYRGYRYNMMASNYDKTQTTNQYGVTTFPHVSYTPVPSAYFDARAKFVPDDYNMYGSRHLVLDIDRDFAGAPKWLSRCMKVILFGVSFIPGGQAFTVAGEFVKSGVPVVKEKDKSFEFRTEEFSWYSPGDTFYYIENRLDRKTANVTIEAPYYQMEMSLYNKDTKQTFPLYAESGAEGAYRYNPGMRIPTGNYQIIGAMQAGAEPEFILTGVPNERQSNDETRDSATNDQTRVQIAAAYGKTLKLKS